MYVLHSAMTDAHIIGTRLHVQFVDTDRSVLFEALRNRKLIQCIHKTRIARRHTSRTNRLVVICSIVSLCHLAYRFHPLTLSVYPPVKDHVHPAITFTHHCRPINSTYPRPNLLHLVSSRSVLPSARSIPHSQPHTPAASKHTQSHWPHPPDPRLAPQLARRTS